MPTLRSFAICAAAALLCLAGTIRGQEHGMGAAGASVLVFPAEGPADRPGLAWVGEALAQSISEQLEVPGIKVFTREERENLVEGADLPPNTPLSRGSMIRVAQLAGASHLLLGAYTGIETGLRIGLRILEVRSLKLSGEISAHGPLSALPDMENELAWNVLAELGSANTLTREQFKQRKRAVPNTAYSTYIRALMTNDDQEQTELLVRALRMYPDLVDASYRAGRHYYQHSDWANAIPYLEMAQKQTRTYPDTLFMLGTAYLKREQVAPAIHCFTSELSFGPSTEALNNLGVAYMRKGDYTLAVQTLIEAHNVAKGDPSVTLNLAVARHLQGNYSIAESLLTQAVRSESSRALAYFVLSLALEAQGKGAAAQEALGNAVKAGADLDKLRADGPRSWTRILTSRDDPS